MKQTKTILFAGALLACTASLGNAQIPFQARMGDPLQDLTAAELVRFFDGRLEFDTILTEADGLGPIFNDSSCAQCHSGPTIGGFSTTAVTRFGKAAAGGNPFDPLVGLGGSLLQEQVIASFPACLETVPPAADVVINRLTPHTFGAGLLEAVDDQDIVDLETNPPGPVSGMVRMASPVEGGPDRVARFGWKGGVATVFTFSADASLNEMGLTSTFFPNENAPNGDASLLLICDTVPDPEDFADPVTGLTRIDRQTDFQVFLAAPPQTPRSGMTGAGVFDTIGCSACHVASFTTMNVGNPALSNKLIKPYSDFLLHDMADSPPLGDGCGDGIVDGIATEREMMTRALWGMGQRESFLHDGRATGGTFAQNVDMTIQDHGGEAAFARTNYNALSSTDKDALYAFLESLGRPEFDEDNNNTVDVFDHFFLAPLFTGPDPVAPVSPDDPGAVADVDQDGDYDIADWMVFQRAFTGQ
ncbi:MAG: hypothetical protein O7B99_00195 [Planctomycetota bacterium]|nr:hypothetical protein [Planctomycetota bacterium]